MKRYLFTMCQPPHQGSLLQEKLDIILITAAFDQPVSLLFMDDGIFQIKRHQQTKNDHFKNTLAAFNALALYDIHDLYVEVESLLERGIIVSDLSLPVREIFRKDVAGLMRSYDIIY